MDVRSRIGAVLDFFLPNTCAGCGGDCSGALCVACFGRLPCWRGRICRRCGEPLPDGGARCWACRSRPRGFHICRSAGLYEGVLENAVRRLKYGGRRGLAAPLARFMAETWGANFLPEIILPVPLHFIKRHARGYNQAALLALEFGRRIGAAVDEKVLARKRFTRSQTGLGAEARQRNVEGAFRVAAPDRIAGRRVLLIDDVCSTGATLEACARVLRAAGARRVAAFTLARRPRGPLSRVSPSDRRP